MSNDDKSYLYSMPYGIIQAYRNSVFQPNYIKKNAHKFVLNLDWVNVVHFQQFYEDYRNNPPASSDDASEITHVASLPTHQSGRPSFNFKVVNARGGTVYFKIHRDTLLSKARTVYANKAGMHDMQVRFFYDGEYVVPDATPMSLDMREDDTIQAVIEGDGIILSTNTDGTIIIESMPEEGAV